MTVINSKVSMEKVPADIYIDSTILASNYTNNNTTYVYFQNRSNNFIL